MFSATSRNPVKGFLLRSTRSRLPAALLVGVLVAGAFAVFASAHDAEARARVAEDTWAGANAARSEWRVFLQDEAGTLNALDGVWRVSGDVSPTEFLSLLNGSLETSRAATSLSVVDSDGSLRWIRPPSGLAAPMEQAPAAWAPTLEAAATNRTVILSGVQPVGPMGEPGFLLARALTAPDGRSAGVAVAEVPLRNAMSAAFGPATVRAYSLTFIDAAGPRATVGGPAVEDMPRVRASLEPPAWTVRSIGDTPVLEVQASEAYYAEAGWPGPSFILGAGVLTGVVVAGGAWRELGRRAEREEARRRVALSEAHYRDLFESAGELILLLTPAGRIVRANRHAERTLGAPDGGLAGRNLVALAAGGTADDLRERLRGLAADPQGGTFEACVVAADGRHVDLYGTVTPERSGAGTVTGLRAYLADVTTLRRLEERLRRANRNLSEKLHELDSFAYTVAHDLKNPLRGVSSYAEFLEEDFGGNLPAEGREYVHQIRAGSDRMRDMVEALLRYARAGSTQYPFERVVSTDVVADAITDLRSLLDERHATVRVAPDLPEVTAQRVPLKQVFQNLLANAVKYNDKAEPVVEVDARRDDDGLWEFTVADNGPGVLEAERDRLFDLFHRGTGTAAGGTGVGLAIVKRIVEAHGGHVWVENRPGGGAAFRFTLADAPGDA